MARSVSAAPVRKVTAGGLAGALSIAVVWLLKQFANVDTPPVVATAFTTILSFLVSYIVPPAEGEVVP